MGYAGSQFHRGPNYLQDPLTPLTRTPPTFCNTEQSVTLTCPEGTTGDPVTAIVQAGTYCGYATQEEANAVALAAAQTEAEALREASPCTNPLAGSVWGWGYNQYSSIGVGNSVRQCSPVVVAGNVLEWLKIDGGAFSSAGIQTDGSLWTWGANFSGELGQGNHSVFPSTANNLLYPKRLGTDTWLDVTAREEWMVGVKSDGTLWYWGDMYNSGADPGQEDTPVQIGTDSDWVKVVGGDNFLLAQKSDGTLWGWQGNEIGQLGDGTTTDSTTLIPVGNGTDTWIDFGTSLISSYGIKSDGTLWAWGDNSYGQLGIGSFDSDPHPNPVQVGSDTDWVKVCGNRSSSNVSAFAYALKSGGTLWAWGNNLAGQLGQGNTTDSFSPIQIGSDTTWEEIVAGSFYGIFKKSDGTLWGCGANNYCQLAQGSPSTQETSLVQIGGDDQWVNVFSGEFWAYGIRGTTTPPPAPAGSGARAFGGTYYEAGGYSYHIFQTNNVLTVYGDVTVDYLLVGGGGGGGGLGGGGGGEVIRQTGVSLAAGDYNVAIAWPQAFGAFGGEDAGSDGGPSSFNGETVAGGGGGGAGSSTNTTDAIGRNGASGGGGGTDEVILGDWEPHIGGTGSVGGNGGDAGSTGTGVNQSSGGGGGGMGGIGQNGSGTVGGDGGTGLSDDITGTSVFYGAGGGGGGYSGGGAGGSSVGGTGATAQTSTLATEGLTAGSGGGGTYKDALPVSGAALGGAGALGVLILRYLTPP